jgi:4-carboxymuconolactone decarboxylase
MIPRTVIKAHVDNEICAGHGNCTAICPGVFELDDDGYANVIVEHVPVELEATARMAADQCPEHAISIEAASIVEGSIVEGASVEGETSDATAVGAADEQRIPPLTQEQWGDAEYAAFGAMLGMPPDRVPRAGSDHKYDPMKFTVVGVLAQHPELAQRFLRYNRYLLTDCTLDTRSRELVILRVAMTRRCTYEWGQHVKMALDAGITEHEVTAVAGGRNVDFSGAERLMLEATDELLDASVISDATWSALSEVMSRHQIMDLVFVVGTYALLAMAFESFGFTPEPGLPPLPDA